MVCKELNVLITNRIGQTVGGCAEVKETSLFCLGNPRVVISVSVKDNALMLGNGLLDKLV